MCVNCNWAANIFIFEFEWMNETKQAFFDCCFLQTVYTFYWSLLVRFVFFIIFFYCTKNKIKSRYKKWKRKVPFSTFDDDAFKLINLLVGSSFRRDAFRLHFDDRNKSIDVLNEIWKWQLQMILRLFNLFDKFRSFLIIWFFFLIC